MKVVLCAKAVHSFNKDTLMHFVFWHMSNQNEDEYNSISRNCAFIHKADTSVSECTHLYIPRNYN